MADEQRKTISPQNWQSSIIWVVGLIFICGMTYNTVTAMQDDVKVNTGDIKKNTESIHENELLFTGLKTAVDATKEDTTELKVDMKALKEYLMQYDYGKKKELK